MVTIHRTVIHPVAFVVAILACLATMSGCKPPKITIEEYEIVLINLWKKKPVDDGNNPTEYHGRLEQIAAMLRDQHLDSGRTWDFVALNECFYQLSDEKAVPLAIPCSATNSSILASQCFDAHLRDTTVAPDITLQFGENGLIARGDELTQVGPPMQAYLPRFGVDGISEPRIYDILGGRFRLPSGRILPVWVVKLPTIESSQENRSSQLGGAMNFIKQMWQPGDLTPLLVGDVNFVPDSPLGQKLAEDFVEITRVLPEHDSLIETIWVGKEKKYPGACGTLEFVEHQVWGDAAAAGLTDHVIVYAKLRLLTWDGNRTLNTMPLAMTVDRPAMCENVLAWTAVGSDGFIYLSGCTGRAAEGYSADLAYEEPWRIKWPGADHYIRSLRGPALTHANAKTYLAWAGRDANNVNVFSTNRPRNTEWEGTRTKFEFQTDCAPTMAAVGTRVFLAWKEQGSANIMVTYSDNEGVSWIAPHYVGGAQTDAGPSLVEHGGRLVMAWINHGDHRLTISATTTEGNLDIPTLRQLGTEPECAGRAGCRQSNYTPALLSVKGSERVIRKVFWPEAADRLYLLWTGQQDNCVRVMSSPDGQDWQHAIRVLDVYAKSAPSVRFREDRFVLAWAQNSNGMVELRETPIGGELSIDVRR